MPAAFAAGFGLGFVVAAQIGPISLLCMRSVLRGRFVVGVAIGAGAAVIDALYAGLGSGRRQRAAPGGHGQARARDRRCARAGGDRPEDAAQRVQGQARWRADEEVASPRRAFLTSLGATASNPLTIASWAAAFSAASTAALAGSGGSAAVLVAGVGAGTLTWFTLLSGGLTLARRRVGPRLLVTVDAISGALILGFACLLGWRTVAHES